LGERGRVRGVAISNEKGGEGSEGKKVFVLV